LVPGRGEAVGSTGLGVTDTGGVGVASVGRLGVGKGDGDTVGVAIGSVVGRLGLGKGSGDSFGVAIGRLGLGSGVSVGRARTASWEPFREPLGKPRPAARVGAAPTPSAIAEAATAR